MLLYILFHYRCQVCTTALFCNEQCRDDAWSRYHKWECDGLEVCHSIGIAHLGLRVALMVDASEQYKQVYELVTHIDDMKAEDIYQYALVSNFLISANLRNLYEQLSSIQSSFTYDLLDLLQI